MRYFRLLQPSERCSGTILVSWCNDDFYWLSYRDCQGAPGSTPWSSPGPRSSNGQLSFGPYEEITEVEALALDPELFVPGVLWMDYEAIKILDAEWDRKNSPIGRRTRA